MSCCVLSFRNERGYKWHAQYCERIFVSMGTNFSRSASPVDRISGGIYFQQGVNISYTSTISFDDGLALCLHCINNFKKLHCTLRTSSECVVAKERHHLSVDCAGSCRVRTNHTVYLAAQVPSGPQAGNKFYPCASHCRPRTPRPTAHPPDSA
jgi:hypothetical protein